MERKNTMGFFEKLGQGLKKTRDSIFGTIADMVSALSLIHI